MEINAETTAVQRCEVQTVEESGDYPRARVYVEGTFLMKHPVSHINTEELKTKFERALRDTVFFDVGDIEA